MHEPKRRSPMNSYTYILVGLASVLLIYALFRGENLAIDGIKLAGVTLWNNLFLLLAGFLLAGLIQVIVPKEIIVTWLGDAAGVKAVLIGCITGGLVPGAPYAVFPIVAGLYQAGAGLGAVIGFTTAWALWSVSRLPVEMVLISPRVALLRYGITFIVPPAAGLLAHSMTKLFR
jgi:uncharacterized protein